MQGVIYRYLARRSPLQAVEDIPTREAQVSVPLSVQETRI